MVLTRACSASCSSSILWARARWSICSKAFTFPKKERLAGSSPAWLAGAWGRWGRLGLTATGGGAGLVPPGASLLMVLLEWES